ncbi:hypothetical protein [Psychrobacillus antarcticus]|uniref:hypothetical protein n=1 Tax=Psychrobacillus antarcticus TaxID=2879115 RepID=UPI0024082115|nr:hypothetical protein [Psychrobacillus antarcticus]
MKKIFTALLGITLLVGCTDEAAKETETEKSPIVKKENEELNDLPEYDLLAQYIDLSTYEADVESDNKGTRVIFFENEEGQKEYKSIFVKGANHLKLVSLDEDGLIYDDVIQ